MKEALAVMMPVATRFDPWLNLAVA